MSKLLPCSETLYNSLKERKRTNAGTLA